VCFGTEMEGLTKKPKKSPRWERMIPPYEVGRDGFEYRNVKKDIEGWADAQIYRPFPYDLVRMKPIGKAIPGWWNGTQWEGSRLKADEKVFYWKQEGEMHDERKEKESGKSAGGIFGRETPVWLPQRS